MPVGTVQPLFSMTNEMTQKAAAAITAARNDPYGPDEPHSASTGS